MEVMEAMAWLSVGCIGLVVLLAIGVDIYDHVTEAVNRRRAGR